MTRMPFLYASEPEPRPGRQRMMLHVLLTAAVLGFCGLIVFR